MAVNNFDRVAPIYDWLAKLVFGDSLLDGQTFFLDLLDNESHLLILGGGSGMLLEELPAVKDVDYVEKSYEMIQQAKKRRTENSISFAHQDFLEWETEKQYDFIFCPFFLDCFNEENLKLVISKIQKLLKPEGRLLVTEFEVGTTNNLLSGLMHFFFRITANLESKRLASIHLKITTHNFELDEEKFFYQNMIFSRVYRNL